LAGAGELTAAAVCESSQKVHDRRMFEEGQYFAPVIDDGAGALCVQLGPDHPGFADPVYRARRDALATLAAD